MKRPNGSGSISKYSGRRKPWKVLSPATYDPVTLKSRRTVIGYYATRKEAEAALAQFNANPYKINENTTFGEIFEKWIERKRKQGKSQTTINSYRAAFKRCGDIADKPIRKLKLNDLIGVFDQNSNAGKSTVTNIKIVIDGVFEYAERNEFISKNYARLIGAEDMLYTKPEEEKHRLFTQDEIDNVFSSPRDIYTDCTIILLYTGFRVEELLSMTRDNINIDGMFFKGGLKTAAGKDRIVPIHDHIAITVAKYYAKANGRVFPITQDKLRCVMKERWDHLPHDTRHTFISRLQSLHADHVCIERLVGHTSKTVTDKIYTHKDFDELRECIMMLDYHKV